MTDTPTKGKGLKLPAGRGRVVLLALGAAIVVVFVVRGRKAPAGLVAGSTDPVAPSTIDAGGGGAGVSDGAGTAGVSDGAGTAGDPSGLSALFDALYTNNAATIDAIDSGNQGIIGAIFEAIKPSDAADNKNDGAPVDNSHIVARSAVTPEGAAAFGFGPSAAGGALRTVDVGGVTYDWKTPIPIRTINIASNTPPGQGQGTPEPVRSGPSASGPVSPPPPVGPHELEAYVAQTRLAAGRAQRAGID